MAAFWAISLVLVASFLGGLGAIFLKKGAEQFKLNLQGILYNKNLIVGVTLYGLSVVLFVPALKGGEVSILYPMVATSYIWSSLFSVIMLKEKMSKKKWLSICFIIVGIAFLSIG